MAYIPPQHNQVNFDLTPANYVAPAPTTIPFHFLDQIQQRVKDFFLWFFT